MFQSIDDEKIAARISAFVEVFHKDISASATDIICIDGKAMRSTLYDNGHNPNIVSAYSLRSGFTLATDVCKEKSNEIKTVRLTITKRNEESGTSVDETYRFHKIIAAALGI